MFLSFESAALKIDGFLNEKEWKNTQPTVLVTDSDAANCEVDKGIVSVFCDESTERIHLGFKVSLTDYFDDKNTYYGVAVSVDSGDFIKITLDGISAYDIDKFSVEAEITAYSDSAFGVEAVIGVKYGLSAIDTVRVRFIDADGSPSNVYTVKVPRDTVAESETVQLQQPIYNNGLADNEINKTTKVKNTASKTSKPKTTKHKTTTTSGKGYDKDDVTTAFAVNGQGSDQANQLPQEETTVMTVRQVKMQKGFTYAAVAALILLALGICVAVNLARDKEKNKK